MTLVLRLLFYASLLNRLNLCLGLQAAKFEDSSMIDDDVELQTNVEERSINDTHTFLVSRYNEFYIKFELTDELVEKYDNDSDTHIFQVNAASIDANEQHPVDVTVRQFSRIINFRLPHTERDSVRLLYQSQRKSVDFCPVERVDGNSTVIMSLTTSSRSPVTVTVRVLIKGKQADWVRMDDGAFESKTTITPAITRIRYFQTDLIDSTYINVKVSTRPGSDCLCSLVSIQDPFCPFHDEIGSAMRFGLFNKMLNFSTIIVDSRDYPEGFILVLVASATDDLCQIVEDENKCAHYNANVTDPRKKVRIRIEANATDATYIFATLFICGAYIGIAILVCLFSFIQFRYTLGDFDSLKDTIDMYTQMGVQKINQFSENLRKASQQEEAKEGFYVSDAIQRTLGNSEVAACVGFGSPVRVNTKEGDEVNSRVSLYIDEENKQNSSGVDIQIAGIDNKNSSSGVDNKIMLASTEDIEEEEDGEANRDANERELKNFVSVDEIETKQMRAMKVNYSDIATEAEVLSVMQCEDQVDLNDKIRLRLKTDIRVTDLSMKLGDPSRTKSIYQKSELYLGILLLVSIYYSLPVLQMVFSFSHAQRVTGDQDICYYNDLCRRPLSLVRDFNHLFSNMGYMVFGALFMLLVYFKKWKSARFYRQHQQTVKEDEYGVPQQYGLYFSMGLALFMEGLMSGSYHICPTNITFQFDTTFMYLISILMFLKLYQIRHADVSANAVGVFFGLGVALILETISIFYNGPWFWAFFCTAYMCAIIVAIVHGYNIGVVKYDYKILYNVFKIISLEMTKIAGGEPDRCVPRVRSRLVFLIVSGLVNVALCLLFGITGASGASNYLLAIFILNFKMYFLYYVIMKVLNGEKINTIPKVYGLMALICSIPALYLFTQKEKDSEVSPSESRMMNVDCMFLDFFDGHDIWHFMGGSGLFFAFLAIFTIDEDLKYRKRASIAVF